MHTDELANILSKFLSWCNVTISVLI